MASLQRNKKGKPAKTWRARAKLLGDEHYLGSYATKEEAEKVEREYREYLVAEHGKAATRGYNDPDYRRMMRRR